jgi:Vps53-like, N-terminal
VWPRSPASNAMSTRVLALLASFGFAQPTKSTVPPADQLQRAVERNEYGEAAHLIEAVQQLAGHFQSFVAIPKVAELSGRVATLQRAVQVIEYSAPGCVPILCSDDEPQCAHLRHPGVGQQSSTGGNTASRQCT